MEPSDVRQAALAAFGAFGESGNIIAKAIEENGGCTFYRYVTEGVWPQCQGTMVKCGDSIIAIDSVDTLRELLKRWRPEMSDIHAFSRFFEIFLCPPSKNPPSDYWEQSQIYVPYRYGEAVVLYWHDFEIDAYEEVAISSGAIDIKVVALGRRARLNSELEDGND